MSQQPLTG
ncbi:Protein of unknown function [Propionibacterium freudenreichii subsp. freudenreichii]|uniref:Uncharacterized protein n=1 Tax=Propionibacterium freudenreichii subsp. freudenreichii TaxID=66712 RepID=A0A0B7NYJ0_PROFF|nr:Protein of unknown function [Propionibacterium freudenreichii]CEP25693.1 Protein of unknown function [Propionibacterium freudenreichii subsp. freudenreichii]CEH09436.1 Protein of unknown function [Propionibacterium freudenreichii]CEI21985.1 Protein of unknown function [Propionibacterium freudenreichii]CEI25742.1 Protein of unknown function [Propionibacterium freudenreichii]